MNQITGYTKILGVIADPIKHSLSPAMHNAACQKLGLDYVYVAFEVTKEEFDTAIEGFKAFKIDGFNISMPYKQAVVKHVDELSVRAELCGAVNTVIRKGDKYIGDITDGPGMMLSMYDKGWEPKGKKMVLLGAGGAAVAIMVQAIMDGVKELVVYRRDNESYAESQARIDRINETLDCHIVLKPLEDLESLRKDIAECYVLVNATSVGMSPYEGESCLPDSSYIPSHVKVADVIYNPAETKLIQQAKEAGAEYMNGELMILFQGAESFVQWTGKEMPIPHVKKAIHLD